jgi:hypothetical protein
MIQAPMAYPWRIHGVPMVYPWRLMAPHGASWWLMAPHGASWRLMVAHGASWRTHGASWRLMAHPWRTHGASWRPSWRTHGAPIAPHGVPMAYPLHLMAPHGASWRTHGVPIAPHGASWRTHGVTMAPHGVTMAPHGVPMAPHGVPMAPHGAPMAPHGAPMAPHGASWRTHGVPMAPHGAMTRWASGVFPWGRRLFPRKFSEIQDPPQTRHMSPGINPGRMCLPHVKRSSHNPALARPARLPSKVTHRSDEGGRDARRAKQQRARPSKDGTCPLLFFSNVLWTDTAFWSSFGQALAVTTDVRGGAWRLKAFPPSVSTPHDSHLFVGMPQLERR